MTNYILSFLESKILDYLKQTKKTFLTYEELHTLIKPYHVEDFIKSSSILYEKEPGKFYLISSLLHLLSHDGSSGGCLKPKAKTEGSSVRRAKISKYNRSSRFRKSSRNYNEKRKWKENRSLYRKIR